MQRGDSRTRATMSSAPAGKLYAAAAAPPHPAPNPALEYPQWRNGTVHQLVWLRARQPLLVQCTHTLRTFWCSPHTPAPPHTPQPHLQVVHKHEALHHERLSQLDHQLQQVGDACNNTHTVGRGGGLGAWLWIGGCLCDDSRSVLGAETDCGCGTGQRRQQASNQVLTAPAEDAPLP